MMKLAASVGLKEMPGGSPLGTRALLAFCTKALDISLLLRYCWQVTSSKTSTKLKEYQVEIQCIYFSVMINYILACRFYHKIIGKVARK